MVILIDVNICTVTSGAFTSCYPQITASCIKDDTEGLNRRPKAYQSIEFHIITVLNIDSSSAQCTLVRQECLLMFKTVMDSTLVRQPC
mmetsp:Transcript_32071/g.53246  ORF Transcript_32071/g.53246 Transcript_32071/m.53246 type:complete len:88 (+) Transcript_32071:184-447(+)